MEKEKLISKLNIIDYNNQLEKILSKKTFSEDTKNLLLSMLYKIENSYKDYSKVTNSNRTKKDILEEIIDIIAKDCETIEIHDVKISQSIPKEQKIITYLNATKILYEIYQVRHQRFNIPEKYYIIKKPLEDTLNQGYSIASAEIIRDFDGWSWNILKDEIENNLANFVFQTIKLLVGEDFLIQWMNDNQIDGIAQLEYQLSKQYGQDIAQNLLKYIEQIAIINSAKDIKERHRIIKIQNELQKQSEEHADKKKFLTKMEKEKKHIVERIKEIDNALNNDKHLKVEFIRTNELLDMNHRVFSLSDFVEKLEEERKELINKLDNCNKKMEPFNYIEDKEDLENNLKFLNEINLQGYNKKIYNTKVKELLEWVIKSIRIRADKLENKEDAVKLIYLMRYYEFIYIDKDNQVRDIIDLNPIKRTIITNACKKRLITIFSHTIKENYEIVKPIFQTDILELEKISFKFMKQNNKIILDIYDEETLYQTIEFKEIEEFRARFNKKIKLFI